MSKKQVIKLNESKLNNIIEESIKRVLKESANDIDADTYYGGGIPEGESQANVHSAEQDILEAFNQMKPYIDKIADICNNSDCTMPGMDNKMFQILNAFDEIPRLAKYYQTTELPLDEHDDYVPDEDDLAYADEVDMNPDLMLGYMMKKHGVYESKLDGIIKESINKVLNESRYADAIADRLFAQLENPNTPIYKKNQIKQELISMGYLQMPNKQSQQTTQQRGGDIYSQTIQALNSNNHVFFSNGNGRQLQNVLSGLYNQGKITYNEYNKGMQWIGQGFQYSNAPGKYN